MKKLSIGDDKLLKAIDAAPQYQPIPPEIFKERHRKEYLNWRNKQISRPDVSRDRFINLSKKTVLDLGCEIGYFGWNNAKKIKHYVGIDSDPTCIRAAQIIMAELRYKNLCFINADLISFIKTLKIHYDTCLFFSIYHHLLYQIGIEESRKTINKISKLCDELYFDMGQKDEPSNPSRQKWHDLLPNITAKCFIMREILLNTCFQSAFILGETKVGNFKRLLFRFAK